jgi:hypothetical protein
MVVLRVLMLTVGRFFRNAVRKLLQRRLITGKESAPFKLTRTFHLSDQGLQVKDCITRVGQGANVKGIRLGVGQTSIYIAASQPWEHGWLLPWSNLDHLSATLNREGTVTFDTVHGQIAT